jgi:hypothetical protein
VTLQHSLIALKLWRVVDLCTISGFSIRILPVALIELTPPYGKKYLGRELNYLTLDLLLLEAIPTFVFFIVMNR